MKEDQEENKRILSIDELIKEDIKDVTIRTGEALPELRKDQQVIQGTICAPIIFLGNREPDLKLGLVKYDDSSVVYIENIEDQLSHSAKGIVINNPELDIFNINTNVPFTISEFAKLVKFNKRFFSTRDAANSLWMNLANFKAKVQTHVENTDDRRANIKKVLDKRTETDLPTSFGLTMPVIHGHTDSSFDVVIELEPSGDSVNILLYSESLIELQALIKKNLVTDIVQELSERGLSCIRI